eukprot:16416_1
MNFLKENQDKINQLLSQLKIYKEDITDKNVFWNQIGFIVNNDDHELLTVIQKHPLLLEKTEYKKRGENGNKIILERLIEELGVNVLTDETLKIEYLLLTLQKQKGITRNKYTFWKEIGLEIDTHLLSKILKHSLLSNYNLTIAKTILENLVEELKLNNVLQEYLSFDIDNRLDYFLKQLKLHKERIPESNVFWKHVGYTINNNELFLSIVKTYSTPQNKDILRKLVEELKIYGLIHQYFTYIFLSNNVFVDAHDNILLRRVDNSLETEINEIISNYVFTTNNETDTFLDKMNTVIKENNTATQQQMESLQQYLNYNEYDTDSVIEDINHWIENKTDEVKIKSNIYQHVKHVLDIHFAHTDLQIITGLIQAVGNINKTQFVFNNMNEFKIPIIPLIGTNTDFVCNLYVKPLNNPSIKFMKIKTFNNTSSKYIFSQMNSVNINKIIKVPKFNKKTCSGGVIQISSYSTVIINQSGKLDANECGSNAPLNELYGNDDNKDNDLLLMYGGFIRKDIRKHDYHEYGGGLGGGIIEIISRNGDIINEGILTNIGTNNNYSSGTISIIANGNFINSGKIISSNIVIKCKKYINKNGEIISHTNEKP